jgi:hypothetical protein
MSARPLILLLAFSLMGQQQENPPFRLPDGVEMQPDLVYGSGGGRDLRLDLYLPKTDAGLFRP